MNKYKNGNLTNLGLAGCFSSYQKLDKFFDSFQISEKMHEDWYGDTKVAEKMKGE